MPMEAMSSSQPDSQRSSSSSPSLQSSTTQQPDTQSLESFKIKSYRPVPLTAGQEGEIRDIYYRNVRAKCADQIRDFAHCATGRTFTIPFKCRQERKAMETCMIGYATHAEEDAAREEWFATVGERRRKQMEDERWKQSQKALKRDWWADYEKQKGVVRPPESSDGK